MTTRRLVVPPSWFAASSITSSRERVAETRRSNPPFPPHMRHSNCQTRRLDSNFPSTRQSRRNVPHRRCPLARPGQRRLPGSAGSYGSVGTSYSQSTPSSSRWQSPKSTLTPDSVTSKTKEAKGRSASCRPWTDLARFQRSPCGDFSLSSVERDSLGSQCGKEALQLVRAILTFFAHHNFRCT
jgi:hypothetical protein